MSFNLYTYDNFPIWMALEVLYELPILCHKGKIRGYFTCNVQYGEILLPYVQDKWWQHTA